MEGQIPSDCWIFLTNPSPTRVRGLSGAGAPSATARPGGLRGLAERCVKLFYTTIKKMVEHRHARMETVADLLISRISSGVVVARPTDPFSTLEVHRIDRQRWKEAPARPGVYVLYGFVKDSPVAYVGMSTTSILGRISSHHVTASKNWFGTLFAVPIDSPVLCAPVEAELIRRIREAGVVDFVDNKVQPQAFLDAGDVHVGPALDNIIDALGVLLGTDIFTPNLEDEVASDVTIMKKVTPLARVYKDAASQSRPRLASDPVDAAHSWIGSQIVAWGKFIGPEPDNRFLVFAGSQFRRVTLDPGNVTYGIHLNVDESQRSLQKEGVLDFENLIFIKDHVFQNWSRASYAVSGKATYSGGYHWQQIS